MGRPPRTPEEAGAREGLQILTDEESDKEEVQVLDQLTRPERRKSTGSNGTAQSAPGGAGGGAAASEDWQSPSSSSAAAQPVAARAPGARKAERAPSRQTTSASTIHTEVLEQLARPASRTSSSSNVTALRSSSSPDSREVRHESSKSTRGSASGGAGGGGATSEDWQSPSSSSAAAQPVAARAPGARKGREDVTERSTPSTPRRPKAALLKANWNFEDVLKNALGEEDEAVWLEEQEEEGEEGLDSDSPGEPEEHRRPSEVDDDSRGSELMARRTSGERGALEMHSMLNMQVWRLAGARVLQHRAFSGFFMLLTVYALFSTDFDLLLGTKQSKLALSIVTTVVFGLFLVELIMQSCWKQHYACRAYFWLDLVALISLLPDTWLVQTLILGNEGTFAAGRSSKLARIIRVASRSSKAMGLKRLTRIVRVAALMPRLAALFVGKQAKEEEAQKLLNKRLFHIFAFLDEDMDRHITQEAMLGCIAKIKADAKVKKAAEEFRFVPRGASSASVDTAASGRYVEQSTTTRTDLRAGATDSASQLVDFAEFKRVILEDEWIRDRLTLACQQQVSKSNNMQNMASRHSEDMGIKVALGVLLLLLVLGLLGPTAEDQSALLGLEYLDFQVGQQAGGWSNSTWPTEVREHIAIWAGQVAESSAGRAEVLYLDIQHRVFCNELAQGAGGRPCKMPQDVPVQWARRVDLTSIDSDLFASGYRIGDLELLRVFTQRDLLEISETMSGEEFDRKTTSSGVLHRRHQVEAEARISIMTTAFVIIIILAGIVLLTRDVSFLSVSLLRPLRGLAEEMQSIVQLRLAGLAAAEAVVTEKSCAEIRMLERIFDNMKKAIKSWGKYVPWPVVQILLSAGVDAKPGVRERDVTIFLSDIAGFTSMVEHLPPEESLVLLSRYFNDMSKVIDGHRGIVIEFIGDAILSVFGAPLRNPDHPTACVRAALQMLAALKRINVWAASVDLPEISIRCGVHTGKVLVGNMGFHSRIKYGIVGESAQVPHRLEELSKTYGTKLLISHATHQRISADLFVSRPVDYVRLPSGRGSKVELVYEVLAKERQGAAKHRLRPVATLHRRAMKEYRDGHFHQASQLFVEVSSMMKELMVVLEDGPSALMLKRCEAYRLNPPAAGWDGVWVDTAEAH